MNAARLLPATADTRALYNRFFNASRSTFAHGRCEGGSILGSEEAARSDNHLFEPLVCRRTAIRFLGRVHPHYSDQPTSLEQRVYDRIDLKKTLSLVMM